MQQKNWLATLRGAVLGAGSMVNMLCVSSLGILGEKEIKSKVGMRGCSHSSDIACLTLAPSPLGDRPVQDWIRYGAGNEQA